MKNTWATHTISKNNPSPPNTSHSAPQMPNTTSKSKKIIVKNLFLLFAAFFLSNCNAQISQALDGRWRGITKSGLEIILIFNGDSIVATIDGETREGKYKIYGSSNPHPIDLTFQGLGETATMISINNCSIMLENNSPGRPRPRGLSGNSVELTKQQAHHQ